MMKYLHFKGRINREELFVLTVVVFVLDYIAWLILGEESNVFFIITLVLFVFYLIQCAKRYHDINKLGLNGFVWWIIPIANIFYFFQLYFLKGTGAINKYGSPSEFRLFRHKDRNEIESKTNDMQSEKYFTLESDIQQTNQPELYNIVSFNSIRQILYNKDSQVRFLKAPSPDVFDIMSVEVRSWNKKNGDYCKVGDNLCTLKVNRKYNHEVIDIYSKEVGILKTLKEASYGYGKNQILDNEKIFQFEELSGSRIFNTPIIEEDKFDKSQILKWQRLGANNFYEKRLNGFLLTLTESGQRLFFTINNINGSDFIVVNFPQKDFDIKSGDKFQILLESQELVNLTFTQNSYLSYESIDDNLRKIKETRAKISTYDLKLLSVNKIENWKISLQTGQVITGIRPFGRDHAYSTFSELQDMFKSMFNDYMCELEKIENYTPIDDYNDFNDNIKEECFLYLMIDTTNNHHKIGISNNPVYRERTLQSEKPTIELVTSKKFPSRQIALSIERALHETFKAKNIRGEWFVLNEMEVNEIKETLK